MKSGNLNFLEPSGPLHACNGTVLPLPTLLRPCDMCIICKNRNNLQFIIHDTPPPPKKKFRRTRFRTHSAFHGFWSVFQYAVSR